MAEIRRLGGSVREIDANINVSPAHKLAFVALAEGTDERTLTALPFLTKIPVGTDSGIPLPVADRGGWFYFYVDSTDTVQVGVDSNYRLLQYDTAEEAIAAYDALT